MVQFLGAVRVPAPALLEALLGEHRESLAQPVHRVDGARVVIDAGGLQMKGCTFNLIGKIAFGSSEELITPGVFSSEMSFLSCTQLCIAKN